MGSISSTVSSTASATVTTTAWWLKDPQAASRNMMIDVLAWEYDEPEQTAVFYPEGRTEAVVLTGEITGIEGQVTLQFKTVATFASYTTLRGGQRALLIQSDMTQQWYVRFLDRVHVKLENTAARTSLPLRRVTIPFVEVTAP